MSLLLLLEPLAAPPPANSTDLKLPLGVTVYAVYPDGARRKHMDAGVTVHDNVAGVTVRKA